MHWLANVWFVGIATGVVSGLITTWLARILLSRRENREYQQSLTSANREVVLAIRTTIPEGELPTRNVIEALRHSTARRFKVAVKDTFTRPEIVQELMKEVMDSSFLSSAKKAEYCTLLEPLAQEKTPEESANPTQTALSEQTETNSAKRLAQVRNRRVEVMSTMVGVLGTVIAALTTVYPSVGKLLAFHGVRDVVAEIGESLIAAVFLSLVIARLPRKLLGKTARNLEAPKLERSDLQE